MAHKKAGGSSRNGRDSAGQRLGVKLFGGEKISGGNVTFKTGFKRRTFVSVTTAAQNPAAKIAAE